MPPVLDGDPVPELLFERGYLVPTRAALDLVEEHQVDLPALLTRHVRGDGGEVGEDGVEANQEGTMALVHTAEPQVHEQSHLRSPQPSNPRSTDFLVEDHGTFPDAPGIAPRAG